MLAGEHIEESDESFRPERMARLVGNAAQLLEIFQGDLEQPAAAIQDTLELCELGLLL
jgi:hypothetical protein